MAAKEAHVETQPRKAGRAAQNRFAVKIFEEILIFKDLAGSEQRWHTTFPPGFLDSRAQALMVIASLRGERRWFVLKRPRCDTHESDVQARAADDLSAEGSGRVTQAWSRVVE